MTDTHWSLKIMSGTHLGAEIDLAPGSYTLGRHEDCDFVLTDATLADQQLEITITDDGIIQLKSLCDHTFMLNGQETGHTCTPEQHQPVSTAGLSFAFGKAGTPWPTLAPSSLYSETAPSEPVNHEDSNVKRHPITQEQTQDKAEQSENTSVLPESSAEKNKKKWPLNWQLLRSLKPARLHIELKKIIYRYRWLLAGITSTSLLVSLGILFFWFWQQTAPENNPQKHINYLNIAEKTRSHLMLPDVHIRRLADGTILVSGYIADNDQKNTLLKQLEEKGVPLKTQLIVMSDMRAAAVQTLKAAGYDHMHIELDHTPGSLVLSGYAPNAKYITKIRELLRTDVPGLLSIVEQVEYQSTREKALRTMLQEAGLNTQIKLLEQPGKIILKGRLNDISQGYRFKEVVATFREKYGQRPQLATDVTIPSTNINTLQPVLDIKSISLGRTPYVILGNGEKYLIGAKLENGYILESIGLDYLILSLGQQRIKYNVRHSHD